MKQYKLVNENRGLFIISNLILTLKEEKLQEIDKLSKIHLILPSKAEAMIEYKLYKNLVHNIVEQNRVDPNYALNHYLKDDYLSLDEALFCLIGLNPYAINQALQY